VGVKTFKIEVIKNRFCIPPTFGKKALKNTLKMLWENTWLNSFKGAGQQTRDLLFFHLFTY
jgi:hypothetical protein